VITLTLLHPVQSTPVQNWSYEHDPVIRIGRAVDNHVVLYSAVVSRYHVEIRLSEGQWEVVNLGTNGTYVDGKRIHQAPLINGSIVRLARSGPNIQISIDGQRVDALADAAPASAEKTDLKAQVSNGLNLQSVSISDFAHSSPEPITTEGASAIPLASDPTFYVGGRYALFNPESAEPLVQGSPYCDHQRSSPVGNLICTDCGFPIHPTQTVGRYQVLKPLSQAGNTMMAWRDGHTVVLKTMPFEWRTDPTLVRAFEAQTRQLCQLEHPGMPKFFEAFAHDGQPYLVSEMIHGPNLKDWVTQNGPVPQYQAVQWMLEISRLLDYLHGQNPSYLHRKIRPSNLIRPRVAHGSSQIVLVDFAEVKGLSVGSGTFLGSVSYTAPEQQVSEDSTLSDLYGLGATLLHLLTGQEPDGFYRLADHEFRLHIRDVPNLSPDLVKIIEKLTNPHPEQRFTSAGAVVEILQPFL
jgi:eukaryotic-like serine/threonine-protein kinase